MSFQREIPTASPTPVDFHYVEPTVIPPAIVLPEESSTISFACPHCNKACNAPLELAGQEAQCSGCSLHFVVPSDEPADYDDEDEPPQRRINPVIWIAFALMVLCIHGGICWGAIRLFNMSQAGETIAVVLGAGLLFAGFGGFILVFGIKQRRRY
jgi:hypothetical protein